MERMTQKWLSHLKNKSKSNINAILRFVLLFSERAKYN